MNNVYDDLERKFVGDILEELRAYGFSIWDMQFYNYSYILKKCSILSDVENFEKIVDILVGDKYFDKIYVCLTLSS